MYTQKAIMFRRRKRSDVDQPTQKVVSRWNSSDSPFPAALFPLGITKRNFPENSPVLRTSELLNTGYDFTQIEENQFQKLKDVQKSGSGALERFTVKQKKKPRRIVSLSSGSTTSPFDHKGLGGMDDGADETPSSGPRRYQVPRKGNFTEQVFSTSSPLETLPEVIVQALVVFPYPATVKENRGSRESSDSAVHEGATGLIEKKSDPQDIHAHPDAPTSFRVTRFYTVMDSMASMRDAFPGEIPAPGNERFDRKHFLKERDKKEEESLRSRRKRSSGSKWRYVGDLGKPANVAHKSRVVNGDSFPINDIPAANQRYQGSYSSGDRYHEVSPPFPNTKPPFDNHPPIKKPPYDSQHPYIISRPPAQHPFLDVRPGFDNHYPSTGPQMPGFSRPNGIFSSFDEVPTSSLGNPVHDFDPQMRINRLDNIFTSLNIYDEECRRKLLCEAIKDSLSFSPLAEMLEREIHMDDNRQAIQFRLRGSPEGERLLTYIEASERGRDRSRHCTVYQNTCRSRARDLVDMNILGVWREVVSWLTLKVLADHSKPRY